MRANVLVALLVSALLVPLQASADPGFSTTRVNFRAGPGTNYPILAVIPYAAPVEIHGCLSSYSWCDVTWARARGWVAARYLRTGQQSRSVYLRHGPPVTSFDFNNYWTSHYRDRPFYRNRDRWRNLPASGGGAWRPVTGIPGSASGSGQAAQPTCKPGTPGCPRFR